MRTHTIEDHQIRVMRQAAARYNNARLVEHCDAALAGDAGVRAMLAERRHEERVDRAQILENRQSVR